MSSGNRKLPGRRLTAPTETPKKEKKTSHNTGKTSHKSGHKKKK